MLQQDMINSIDALQKIPVNSKVCLYGAGEGGDIFKRALEDAREDIQIICFVDSFKRGNKDGLRIIKPEELCKIIDKIDTIFITAQFYKEIEKILEAFGFEKYQYREVDIDFFKYQTITGGEEKKYRSKFEKVKNLLAHSEDRELYSLLIESRRLKSRNANGFLKYVKPMERQYLDYINQDKISIIIEGGVFDGKDTRKFLTLFPKDVFVYGFDPLHLDRNYSTLLENVPRVKIFPLALWEHKCKLRYFENGSCSTIIQEGNQKKNKFVDATSIDEFVEENRVKKVDFIKLDVESAEGEVLKGAQKTLRKHRPQVAVSIYHKKEHLFEIPLLLHDSVENYKYRLAHYCLRFQETILYAIPEEIYRNHR